ncbi:LPS translocon maturation chaperone LptM [Melaminivora sp.]
MISSRGILVSALASMAALVLLAGCGQRGPLYLPSAATQPSAAAAPVIAPATAAATPSAPSAPSAPSSQPRPLP